MLACAALGIAFVGCASTPEAQSLARKADLDTAPITHVVLVQLKDPTRTAELIADCDQVLPAIKGVSGYSCGAPLVTGRTNVTGDYDVGIYVGFRTEAGFDGLETRGVLWGGNLTMVCSLLGTRHFPKFKGGVLFLEDVNEHPYRVERNLLQLQLLRWTAATS